MTELLERLRRPDVVKRAIGSGRTRADNAYRAATAAQRALPDFVILGAQKSATTSLYAYLSEHPDVRPAARKEVHYFDLHHGEGERWYRAMFPRTDELRDAAGGRTGWTGEASPYYLFHPLVPQRLRDLVPHARLVVLLRDPVERAWSHYRHEVRWGHEDLAFGAALDAEPDRLAAAAPAIRRGEVSEAHQNFSYVARGMYAEQLRRWFELFPREQVGVFLFDDLFADPVGTYDLVLDHLGLARGHRPSFDAHNAGGESGLDPELRRRLTETFAGPTDDLAHLLGRDLPWQRP